MWTVVLSLDVQSFLSKQDNQVAVRLRKGLKKLECDSPFHFLEHFEGDDHYKYRVGNFRALIDIDFSKKLIKVQVMDHRSIIYKRYRQ